ncbi:1-aminocyclopropane-1-carboxylate deaminase/D-cysteine desulfhydrase [Jiulongibacter sediminis]|uniref:1-aminocyclopropane-1-carboxylate deaminase/D-cysteine desulfhydrase n=1 Tax=Jiulongibacter sediminis TaxID=1605367 RepID=UPI0026F1E3B6|nr:pyridoxal-phosphate dependent enzyme [Jiulongibacter sediminis]
MQVSAVDFSSFINIPTPLKRLCHPLFEEKEVEVWLKEDYKTHEAVSGNKFRKLKYNLIEAQNKSFETLLTFGGAYSNHIYAVASAAKELGFKSVGIIRGDELNEHSSPTLSFASKMGMELHFVSRSAYRDKEEIVRKLDDKYFLIPEGGSNELALKGVSEMVDEILNEIQPKHLITAAGTGGTAAGILSNENFRGECWVVPVLKNGGFIKQEIESFLHRSEDRIQLFTDYHFGGYGRWNDKLSYFIESFEYDFNIPLDPVYTGKLLFAVMDLIRKDQFPPNSKLVIYHSGGLQGSPKYYKTK